MPSLPLAFPSSPSQIPSLLPDPGDLGPQEEGRHPPPQKEKPSPSITFVPSPP